jgi:sugar lactone lactonase YvrE
MRRCAVLALLTATIGLGLTGAAAQSDAAPAPGGQFASPSGVATDAAGNVYVVDAGNYRVQKFTSDGKFLRKWGREGSGKGEFLRTPGAIAVDGAGDVYVTELTDQQEARLGNRVDKFTSDGRFLARWGRGGSASGEFVDPEGIATSPTGNVYVSDSGNHRVETFGPGGSFVTEWGTYGTGPGQFDWPTGIATDAAGDVYVANSNVVGSRDGDYRIQKFAADGTFLTGWGSDGQVFAPGGIATDSAGDVYVADGGNGRVEKFTSEGEYLTQWGGRGSGPGRLDYPDGIAVDPAGDVFVSDVLSNRIVKFTADGSFLGAWGHGVPAHPGRQPLVIPATRRRVSFRVTCPHAQGCSADVTIEAGGRVLARGHYSIAAHGASWVHVNLTPAGRLALSRSHRVRAKLTIVDTRTHKSKSVPVVLSD